MTLLVLLFREMTLAVRRPGTWWTRVVLGAFGGLFVLAVADHTDTPAKIGRNQFIALSYIAFSAALLAGVRYTAHSIGEEIREGTLGLLLMTRLRRVELVLGKIAGAFLQSLSSLAVILPLVSLPMIFGGVKPADFGLVALVLPATLLISLAAGVFISAREPDEIKGMLMTGLFLAAVCVPFGWLIFACHMTQELRKESTASAAAFPWGIVGLLWAPVIAMGLEAWQMMTPEPLAWSGSPLRWLRVACAQPAPVLPEKIWSGVQLLPVIVVLVLLAARRMPLLVEEPRTPVAANKPTPQPAPVRRRRRSHRPAELLEDNPVAWLVHPPPWFSTIVWGSAALLAVFQFRPLLYATGNLALVQTSAYLALTAELVLGYLAAWQASQWLTRSRHNGEMELLLCTPLSRATVLRGLLREVHHVFLMPLVLVLTFSLIANAGRLVALMVQAGQVSVGWPLAIMWTVIQMAIFGLNYLALGWLGVWLGWSLRRPGLAPATCVTATVLGPWLLHTIFLPVAVRFSGLWPLWVLLFCRVAWSLVCLLWARRRIRATLLANVPPPPVAGR